MSYWLNLVHESEGEIFSVNITSNVSGMWKSQGLDFREVAPCPAQELIEPLRRIIDELTFRPDHYRQFEPANGWGDVHGCRDSLLHLLDACVAHPDAEFTQSS